jgi:hypothetical protein
MASKTKTGNNITIEFKPKGEKQLIAAINALQNSSTSLASSQKRLGKSIGLTEKAQKNQIATGTLAMRNQRNMNSATLAGATSFSVFRSKLLLATFAVGLYAMTIGKLTRAAMEQESSERRLTAAIESTGGAAGLTNHEIFAMTAHLEKVGVVGDEVNNKVAGLMLTFTNIGKDVFPEALAGVNDMAVGMNQGIPAFEQLKSSAIQLSKALQEPDKQYNALRKSGFSFDEAQIALIKSSMKANDISTAQGVILDALKTQFGGLNEAMRGTSEGAMAALGNAAGTVAEDLGTMLMPMIVGLANSLTSLFESFHANRDMIEKVSITVLAITAAIGGFIFVASGAATSVLAFAAAIGVLTVAASPILAVMGAIGFGVFKMLEPFIEARQKAREIAESTLRDKLEIIKVNKDLTEITDKLAETLAKENDIGIKKVNNLKIQNREILGITDAQVKQMEEQNKQIRIQEMLLDIDEEHREGAKASVVAIVEKKIAYEKETQAVKDSIQAIKDKIKADQLAEKQASQLQDLMNRVLVARQKEKEINKDLEKQDFTRIEQLSDFNRGLTQLTGAGLANFKDLLQGTGTVGSLTFDKLTGKNKEFAEALRDAIVAEGSLEAALDSLGVKAKEVTEHQKLMANEFVIGAQLGISSFQNMVGAQGQLIEQRMQREMEAVKASHDYQNATQEERQVMEQNVERKFRDARRRQFRMEKASNLANAGMQVAEAISKALPNLPLAALVSAMGAAQISAIAKQPAPRFATGGSFITSGPTNMLVGESGAERVTVQPLGGRTARQSSGTVQNININVSAPLVDETILDVIIPKIEEAGKLNLA